MHSLHYFLEYHGTVYDSHVLLLVSVVLYSVYEKMREKMEEVGRSLTGFKAKVSAWGKDVGLRGNQNIQKG